MFLNTNITSQLLETITHKDIKNLRGKKDYVICERTSLFPIRQQEGRQEGKKMFLYSEITVIKNDRLFLKYQSR